MYCAYHQCVCIVTSDHRCASCCSAVSDWVSCEQGTEFAQRNEPECAVDDQSMIRARSPIHPPRRPHAGESGSHASCMRHGHYITTYNNDTLLLKPCAMHRFGAVGNSNATLNSGRNCSVVEFKLNCQWKSSTPRTCALLRRIVEAQIIMART